MHKAYHLRIKHMKYEMPTFVEISEEAEEFPHGFTSGGHPVGCAIALKSIDIIINEGLLENVKNVSPEFLDNLSKDTQARLANKDITDHDRYVLNHKLDILEEIRV